MRILIIVPPINYKISSPPILSMADFPSGLAYLSAALQQGGHEVFGLNLNNNLNYANPHDMLPSEIGKTLCEINPGLIALGGLCTEYSFLKDALALIRKFSPNVPIVCGGGIFNNDDRFIFAHLKPDFCITGEAEERIVQLANEIDGNHVYQKIPNLGYWHNNLPVFNEQDFNYKNINTRAFPDYEQFRAEEMVGVYSFAARSLYRYTRVNPRIMSIVTARSCPFNCTFCVHHRGPKYRYRSIENIMKEIAYMYEKYEFNILIIMDELFAANKARLDDFCNTLTAAKANLHWDFDWLFQTHANAALDAEALKKAKKAGAYYFSYGLESASPTVLSSMNKKTKPTQIISAIRAAKEADIGFGGNFIFGDIAEDKKTISETMNFMINYCKELHISMGTIQPYPGSGLFDFCIDKGIIKNKLDFYENIDECDWNMTKLPVKVWFKWVHYLKLFSKTYPWVKSTPCLRYEIDIDSINNPLNFNNKKKLYHIWAKCPYCKKESHYQELLELGNEKQGKVEKRVEEKSSSSSPVFRKPNQIFRELFALLKSKFWRINKLCGLYFEGYHDSTFKLLWQATRGGRVDFIIGISFVTGCSYCNKRVKVVLPLKDIGYSILKSKLI